MNLLKLSLIGFMLLWNQAHAQNSVISGGNFTENINIFDGRFEHQFVIPQSASLVVNVMLPESTEVQNISVTLADGTVVTTENADEHNVSIKSFIPVGAESIWVFPVRTVFIKLAGVPVGVTTIAGDVTVNNSKNMIPIAFSYKGGGLSFENDVSPIIAVNTATTVSLTQTILEDGLPTLNPVNATLTIHHKDQPSVTKQMFDDGSLGDLQANDGIYYAEYVFPQTGRYSLIFESTVVDINGVTHKDSSYSSITVNSVSPFQLTGNFTDQGVDIDGDGFFDQLKITLEFEGVIPLDKKFSLGVHIGTAEQSHSSRYIKIDPLSAEHSAYFDGLDIRKWHTSGPIHLRLVRTFNDTEANRELLSYKENFGSTKHYDKNDFARKKEIIDQKSATFSFIDEDGNNIYEGIKASFIVDVLEDGVYEARARLKEAAIHNVWDSKHFQSKARQTLTAGIHTFDIIYPAKDIIETNLTGPGELALFTFYRYDDKVFRSVDKNLFGITPPFVCWDFGDCSASGHNTSPIASDDIYFYIEGFLDNSGEPRVILDLLSNDADPDGDDIKLVNSNLIEPTNGTVSYCNSGGKHCYIPEPGFSGVDTFTYNMIDFYSKNGIAKSGSDTGTVTINVRANNMATPANDYADGTSGQPITIDVLANDTDPDGDNLFIVSVDQPLNGSANVVNNKVVYTPAAEFVGTELFNYDFKEQDLASGMTGGYTYSGTIEVTAKPQN
ncbi:hypothetical protein EKG38_18360 [Shewanella canadensis]|uniref:Tandem-95 repeat protein n=1 Tax=Shewanella canadensis TaxID=271096 RepID=A0A431WPT1_9GAMM|nr:Ig-like domain-containing protein [Shewanella canadensis]RTR37431.1 hypothetical protein EKG38_18360 [Shewanella canadensis]